MHGVILCEPHRGIVLRTIPVRDHRGPLGVQRPFSTDSDPGTCQVTVCDIATDVANNRQL